MFRSGERQGPRRSGSKTKSTRLADITLVTRIPLRNTNKRLPPQLRFFSSYLPCWRDRDQECGSLLSELCIAHRGSPGGRAIFGYLAGTIFDGLPLILFINLTALCSLLKKSAHDV